MADYQKGKIPTHKSKKDTPQRPKTTKKNMAQMVTTRSRARTIIALMKYQRTPSRSSAIDRNSMQAPGGGQRPTAWIVKGNPTGYQSVTSDVIIVGQTIQPKTKNKTIARISFGDVGKKKEFLLKDFIVASLPPNGLRYRRVISTGSIRQGGTGESCFGGTNFKPHKLPENAASPTCRVHAVLGGLMIGHHVDGPSTQ